MPLPSYSPFLCPFLSLFLVSLSLARFPSVLFFLPNNHQPTTSEGGEEPTKPLPHSILSFTKLHTQLSASLPCCAALPVSVCPVHLSLYLLLPPPSLHLYCSVSPFLHFPASVPGCSFCPAASYFSLPLLPPLLGHQQPLAISPGPTFPSQHFPPVPQMMSELQQCWLRVFFPTSLCTNPGNLADLSLGVISSY